MPKEDDTTDSKVGLLLRTRQQGGVVVARTRHFGVISLDVHATAFPVAYTICNAKEMTPTPACEGNQRTAPRRARQTTGIDGEQNSTQRNGRTQDSPV